jgi:translation initiation factor IF-3
VKSLQEGLQLARTRGLDLVEISPKANPPVCKVLDFGKYRYELAKREKEARRHNTGSKLKELKFHINIEDHDYGVKMRQAEGFMLKGMKTKILMVFRGREMAHKEIGIQLVAKIRQDLLHVGTADAEPKLVGKSITLMLTPLPASKRSRKWNHADDLLEDESDDSESPESSAENDSEN